MSLMLETKHLDVRYGRARILFGVSLVVKRGEVVALLGRNGAGKSTLLKSIIGLVPASAGEVHFAGERIDGLPPFRIARAGVGYVPEERRIFTDLTVGENLEVGRQPPRDGAPGWDDAKLDALFPNLAPMRGRKAARMSGGEQQMLTIARTLMGHPLCLLLDEPTEGLAPLIVEEMAAMVRSLKSEGVSVLLAEQNLRFARAVADRAYIIESGHIRYEGTMDQLAADPAISMTYLAA